MEKNKKDLKKWIILIIVAIVAHWTINNLSIVLGVIGNIYSIISPFILGAVLAFILNIPMTFFEKMLLNTKNKKQPNKKFVRIISIIFSILIILLVFSLIIKLIVPELISVANLLIDNMPYYAREITKLLENYGQNITDINKFIQEANINIEAIKKQIINQIPNLLTSSISILGGIVSGVVNFFIAIIFAIYILIDKEKLKEQTSKLLYAYLSEGKVNKIINIGRVARNTFKNFLTVQCLEASILGILCIIGMFILRIPYAIPIGVLIGVTALIPVVGGFIGAIIGAVLILAVEPFKVITFIIFVLVLQQVEGNLIYPKVVGNSVGLPGMWVLVAVSLGGSLGGILGMLLGVPIVTILYTLLKKDVKEKLDKK